MGKLRILIESVGSISIDNENGPYALLFLYSAFRIKKALLVKFLILIQFMNYFTNNNIKYSLFFLLANTCLKILAYIKHRIQPFPPRTCSYIHIELCDICT